jgi:ribonuclease P protein component
MLPARHRLTRPEDFTAVFRGGSARAVTRSRRSGTDLLVVHRADREGAADRLPRVGFVVSGAVGNSVVRHRVTRRIRHLMAARLPAVPAGTDLVVRATPRAARASSEELGAALDQALARALR